MASEKKEDVNTSAEEEGAIRTAWEEQLAEGSTQVFLLL